MAATARVAADVPLAVSVAAALAVEVALAAAVPVAVELAVAVAADAWLVSVTAAFTGATTAAAGAAAAFTAETAAFTGVADASVPTAVVAEPTVAASPDVTAGTTDPLVTTCVTACTALPEPVTTVTTAEPGAGPAQHAGQPAADGAGRCRLTTGAGTVPGGNPETVGGFGETGGRPPPAGLGTLPPEVLEVLPPRLPVRAGSIGGPVGTGGDWGRWRGWSGPGAMAGAEPIPNKPGRIAGTMTDVTRVNRMMAVTMTALGAAIPAG